VTGLLAELAAFHFIRPWWLLALIPVLLLAWLVRRSRQAAGDWGKVIDPVLLPFLLDRPSLKQPALARWCLAGWICACLGLAGPTWEQVPLPVHRQENALIILLDLSPSMMAQDLAPDRLIRTRLKLTDILNSRSEGVTALVAYGGDAHVVSPLTDDRATIISQLPALDPAIMPSQGSNPEAAVELGVELALNAGHLQGDILLVTDGMTQGAQHGVELLLNNVGGFRLSILGVGTEEGAPIPLPRGGFAKDERGGMIIAKLQPKQLAGLARRQGGRYSSLTSDDRDLHYLLDPINIGFGDKTRELQRTFDSWKDQGFWLALLLLPLMVLGFRRNLLALLVLAPLALQPQSARASLWDDLWRTPDQQGQAALADDPDRAAELFKDRQWQGTAAYRAGDYQRASEAFAEDNSARGQYNQGNALARAGKLGDALAAYDRALALQPDMEDADFNKKLVEQMLQQQQQQQQNQSDGQDNSQNQNPEGNQDSSPSQNAKGKDSQGQQDDFDSQGNESEGNNKSNSDSPQNGQGNNMADRDGQDSGGQDRESTGEDKPGEEQPGEKQSGDKDSTDDESRQQQAPKGGEDPTGNDGEPNPIAGSANPDDALDQEQQQAMEQWLRRVPDDPGGLLRRKFQYQAQRRAYEQQHRFRSPPDRTEEERW